MPRNASRSPPASWPARCDVRGVPSCAPSSLLSPSALERVANMVVPSYELLRVARRLQSGRPLSITIIGQSNTARNGGCYCDGPNCEHQRGWAHLLGTWLDNKWPHPEHTIHNSGNGGDAADRATRCLDTYLSANTDCQRVVSGRCQVGVGLATNASALQKRPPDVIIADFAVSGWI